MEELFDMMDGVLNAEIEKNGMTKYCRTCKHRVRFAHDEHSHKLVQCCEKQRSRRSNSGYKTIKVTDIACPLYKENK